MSFMQESDIYINTKANNVATEGSVNGKIFATPLLRVNYDREILAYYEGAEFPQKGLSKNEVMYNVNIVKALFIGVFKIRFSIVSVIDAFTYVGNRVLEHYFLKDQYRTAGTKELDMIVSDFIFTLTSNRSVASRFSKLFSHLIEYDNAYRLRLIDLASETTKEKLLKKPIREIKRLMKILAEREVLLGESVVSKFRWVTNVLVVMLLIPKFRKAFKYAIHMADWEKMCWDNIDRYWACLRTDYNFMGMTSEERMDLLKKNGYSLPVQNEYKI